MEKVLLLSNARKKMRLCNILPNRSTVLSEKEDGTPDVQTLIKPKTWPVAAPESIKT
jgi:hypothetical protein